MGKTIEAPSQNALDAIRVAQASCDEAERTADAAALRALLAEDFRSIGPKGFVLDKEQWIGRHMQFKYESLDTSDVDVRLYDRAAIVRNVQRNRGVHGGQTIEVAVRVSQVWIEDGGRWYLAGIQFSPLADA